MSDTLTTTDTAEAAETAEATTPETEKPTNPKAAKLSSEAAKWRTSFREAEGQLAEVNDRLAALQTRELHRLAAEHLAEPGDIELSGKALADYLTPEGWIDSGAVAEAAAEVIESRPGLAKHIQQGAYDPTQGSGLGGGAPRRAPEWADLFKIS